jgi:hypothetical protein
MTTPLPQGIGFSGDTFITTWFQLNVETINLPFKDFNQSAWDYRYGLGLVGPVVRRAILNKAVALGIQDVYDLEIAGNYNKIKCGAEQVFYLVDGSEIMAQDLRVGMNLRAIAPQVGVWDGYGIGMRGDLAGRPYQVTAHGKARFQEMLYHCTTVDTDSFSLASGVVVKAMPALT